MVKPTKIAERQPPETSTVSRQLELFQNFYGTDEYSNTAELWDSIPKHAVDRRQQAARRDANGRLPLHDHTFEFKGKLWRMEVLPALVKDKDGKRRDYYPSADEELVEEVLRKFFADQRFGVHDERQSESWVQFTLGMVRRELKEKGRTRSLDQIKRSLDIMSLSTVRIFEGDSEHAAYSASILSDVVRVTREQYLEDGKGMWAARLPALISKSVNDHEYRQINYRVLMGLDAQLARWFHKRLCQRFRQAGFGKTYRFSFNTVQRDSGLLNHSRRSANVKAMERALDALVSADVLMNWEKEDRRGHQNRIEDVIYTVNGSMTFNAEQRETNARHKAIDIERAKLVRGGGGGRPLARR